MIHLTIREHRALQTILVEGGFTHPIELSRDSDGRLRVFVIRTRKASGYGNLTYLVDGQGDIRTPAGHRPRWLVAA